MSQRVKICGISTASLPKLTRKQQEELMIKIKNGDMQAREEFIIGNMRLVLSLVKRFYDKKNNMTDIFQAGCVGIIKAIDNFDPKFNVMFSTYAVPMIVGEIKRYLRDGNSLRISRSIRDRAYLILKERENIEAKSDKEATLEEIAKNLNIPLKEVVYALDAISDLKSLYDPVYNKNEDTLMLMDQISDVNDNDEKWTENFALDDAINGLSDREKRILMLRYYDGRTQTEISEEVGISQAQVSRLEKNALKSIKKKLSY